MAQEHKHSTTSNTDEVFRTFIGCRVKGLVREITFNGNHAIILVFECGWGLAFNNNGSHWTKSPEDVQRILQSSRKALKETNQELEHILTLAGEES